MEQSELRIYSLGTVAENKALGSAVIQVTPIEQLSMLDGELKSEPAYLEDSGVDAAGKTYASKTIVDNALSATWIPIAGGNRATPPDVRRGERVLLFKYADAEELYWADLGWDLRLRKKETVRYTFSNTEAEGVDSTAEGNCHYVEISSHNKTITLQTSKAQGEPFTYTFQFNLANGVVILADDAGNYFEFDSKETEFLLRNAAETEFRMTKEDIYLTCLGILKAVASREIRLETEALNVTCPLTDISGHLKIGGNISWGGKATGDGSGVANTIPVD